MAATLDLTYRVEADELADWNARFQAATPQELLEWASEQWGEQMALTCSFGGPTGMVLLDMVTAVAPATPVLFLDTGLLFPETYQLVAEVQARYGIAPQAVQPARTVAQQAAAEGPALWERDPDRCCGLRKVRPLAEALAPFDAWIAGIRRDGGTSRANTKLLEWSTKYNLVKLNPLAFWSERDVWRYIHRHNVPYNRLLDQGYRSLGCHTCTRLPTGDDPRSGRWAGFAKTECGLHLEPVPQPLEQIAP
jgi:phosphoadenosine phosphosulfate reductase